MGTNGLSNDKEPKDVANNIIQIPKSVKTDVNKVAFSRILTTKGKFNSKAKEVNTHLQDICSSDNLALITQIWGYTGVVLVINSLPEISFTLLKMGNKFCISLNDSYPHQTDKTTDRDEWNNFFSQMLLL